MRADAQVAPLALGVLGAAQIAPKAVIQPARVLADMHVAAVAARDPERAARFARRHGIAKFHSDYDALLRDPEIDAVYIALPNSLHARWSIRALEAGKHVLCEKPLASNAREAETMAAAAHRSGRVLMEAFHHRCHPLAKRMREIVDGGRLGSLRHVEATLCIPLPLPGDIRYRRELSGGSLMDTGCYTVNLVRFLTGEEPEVVSAEARLWSPGIDRWMRAELRFPSGTTGRITCALFSSSLLAISARVVGDKGEMHVRNPIGPHIHHRILVTTDSERATERVPGRSTYSHQLEAFAKAVRGEAPVPTTARDGVANMRVIDAIYRAAGLEPRASEMCEP